MIQSLFQGPNDQAIRHLLDAATVKHSALASNIANVETPGYKRVDLNPSFAEHLKASMNGSSVSAASLKPTIATDTTATSTRADGNTVQLDKELLEMSRNTADYEVLTQLATGNFHLLKTAISGHSA